MARQRSAPFPGAGGVRVSTWWLFCKPAAVLLLAVLLATGAVTSQRHVMLSIRSTAAVAVDHSGSANADPCWECSD